MRRSMRDRDIWSFHKMVKRGPLPKVKFLSGHFVSSILISAVVVTAACQPHYEGNIPVPDAIPVREKPHRIVHTNCILDVYTLEPRFADILQKKGFRAALDDVGAVTPIVAPPSYKGDSPPRDIDKGEYWYPSPIEAGTFSYTSLRSSLSIQLSQCLSSDMDFKYLSDRDRINPGRDFVSFRDGNDQLYVIYPSEKILVAAVHVD
ncbi:hypothetical protein [Mesorhizobium sp. NPDC059025]|uniref:hypothetical protein n=1 Tax=unclassified Mesorhizobium TaxID=325217 RepID=UPI0036BF8352